MEAFDSFKSEDALGKEFQICALKIAILQLRLLPWRKTVESEDGTQAWGDLVSGVNNIAIAELLEDISTAIRAAERTSARYYNLESHEEGDDETESIEALTENVRRLSRRKQRRISQTQTTRRALWFLRDRKKLNRLIEELTRCVDSLEELLPSSEGAHERSTKHDTQQLIQRASTEDQSDVLSAPWLSVAVSSVDEDLGASLKREASSASDDHTDGVDEAAFGNMHGYGSAYHRGNTIFYSDVAVAHQGNHYGKFMASGNARVQYGDAYGGRSIFDD